MPRSEPELPYPDIGPVPHYRAAAPEAPPITDPLAGLAAELDALYHRAVAAARNDRMHPVGVRDARRLAELLKTLRALAAPRPHLLSGLADPPFSRALALPDLLPCLSLARRICDQLLADQRALARLHRRPHEPTP